MRVEVGEAKRSQLRPVSQFDPLTGKLLLSGGGVIVASKKGEPVSVSPILQIFYLQNVAFSEWAMLGSNQRPPPCTGDKRCCGALRWLAESAYLS